MAMGNMGIGSSLDHTLGPTAPLTTPEIDIGGSHQPELNSSIFSQTVLDWQASPLSMTTELKSPLIESFDKITPNDLLTHSAVLWQAPVEAKAKVNTMLERPISEIIRNDNAEKMINQEFEAPLINYVEDNSPQVQDILNTYMAQELLVIQPSTSILEMAKEKSMEMRELTADVLQAVKVEEALVSTGTNPQEAKEQAIKILTQAEDEKGITEVLRKKSPQPPMEIKFEHDSEADKNRNIIITKAIEDVGVEVEAGKMEKITGKAIAEIMPMTQPESVKSKILTKNQSDGSYENLIVDLSKIDELPHEVAEQEVDKLIQANHAVKLGKANQATEKEVKKVLNGKSSL
jgi:hypothetical protein